MLIHINNKISKSASFSSPCLRVRALSLRLLAEVHHRPVLGWRLSPAIEVWGFCLENWVLSIMRRTLAHAKWGLNVRLGRPASAPPTCWMSLGLLPTPKPCLGMAWLQDQLPKWDAKVQDSATGSEKSGWACKLKINGSLRWGETETDRFG